MLVLSWSGLIGAVLRGTVTLEQAQRLDVVFCFSRSVQSILTIDVERMIVARQMNADEGDKFRTAVAAVNAIIHEADIFGSVYAPINREDAAFPMRVFLKEALDHLKLDAECVRALGEDPCPVLTDVKAAINAAHPSLVVII